MDFLDPKQERAHTIRLLVGYILIGAAIFIATIILLYQAYGFGLGKNGQVVQKGLVFVSSQPKGSQIYVNNKLYTSTTNTRLPLDEGNYSVEIRRDGYHPWQHRIAVQGGVVVHYDYPMLIPNTLSPVAVHNYAAAPMLVTQSPDRRWIVAQQSGLSLGFDVYDLRDPKKVTENTKAMTLPASVVSAASSADQSWKISEWSTDNIHVILEHTYSGGSEYILVDHEQPDKSVNLSRTLNLGAGQVLSLRDKKYDKYYIFDPAARTVNSQTLSDPTLVPMLTNVLAFKSYGSDMLLYATDVGATSGKVATMLKDGEVTYKIREIGVGGPFLLDLAQYSGDWYVAVAASSDNRAYVFKNPQAVRKADILPNLVPVQVLRVTAPNYLAFSTNTQFILLENGQNMAVFDAELEKNYTYSATAPLDAPQAHATWMDGDRLMYVSGGKTEIADYDNTNVHALVAANPAYLPFFDRDYRNLYTLTPAAATTGQSTLTATPLLTKADQ